MRNHDEEAHACVVVDLGKAPGNIRMTYKLLSEIVKLHLSVQTII